MPHSKKVVALGSDQILVIQIECDRPGSVYTAGETFTGQIKCLASGGAIQVDGIAIVLSGTEVATGTIERRPFEWSTSIASQSIDLVTDSASYDGSHSIQFQLPLDTSLQPTLSFVYPSIGEVSGVTVTRSYSLTAVVSLRNSTKVKATSIITIQQDPTSVWPTALPSASVTDSTTDPVGSPLARCFCRRRGNTSISATIHNRTVDLESGVVHVRTHIVNRSPLVVNRIRLCLVVNVSLHEKDEEHDDDHEPPHAVELLNAIEDTTSSIAPGMSDHVNMQMEIAPLVRSLYEEQEIVLQPTTRTKYLAVDYTVRVEVCHANGGSIISLDLPLILVPHASDIPPPLEFHALDPIEGRESQRSTVQDDDVTEIKTPRGSRVFNLELRLPDRVEQGPTVLHISRGEGEEAAADQRRTTLSDVVVAVPPRQQDGQ